jgi:hypothetical protein
VDTHARSVRQSSLLRRSSAVVVQTAASSPGGGGGGGGGGSSLPRSRVPVLDPSSSSPPLAPRDPVPAAGDVAAAAARKSALEKTLCSFACPITHCTLEDPVIAAGA